TGRAEDDDLRARDAVAPGGGAADRSAVLQRRAESAADGDPDPGAGEDHGDRAGDAGGAGGGAAGGDRSRGPGRERAPSRDAGAAGDSDPPPVHHAAERGADRATAADAAAGGGGEVRADVRWSG